MEAAFGQDWCLLAVSVTVDSLLGFDQNGGVTGENCTSEVVQNSYIYLFEFFSGSIEVWRLSRYCSCSHLHVFASSGLLFRCRMYNILNYVCLEFGY